MSDYEVLQIGALDEWRDATAAAGRAGKRFVDKELSTQFVGLSVNAMEPGEQSPFWHTHSALEELYIVLEGRGLMGLDDDVVELGPGTVVRVGQGVWRMVRCDPDSGGELRWLCVRAAGQELGSMPSDADLDRERPAPWD